MGEKKEEEEIGRGNWSGKLDFMLSCIGYAVGLGNVWRFPYLAFRNGGATFLIPYLIMLALAGIPLFYIELALGQFASEGPITVWKVSPIFTGIGFGMCIVSGLVSVYYNVIIMYAMYYMFVSFVNLDTLLPWQHCNSTWNTPKCRIDPYPDLNSMNETDKMVSIQKDVVDMQCFKDKGAMYYVADYLNMTGEYNMTTDYMAMAMDNMTMPNMTMPNMTMPDGTMAMTEWHDMLNSTMLQLPMVLEACKIKWATASEEYWVRSVLMLQDSNGISDIGDVSLRNCLLLFFAWLLIFACLIKGIKSTGKVVYFTATFPYVILIVLLIRGVTLPGYMKGIEFYVIPKPELLLNAKVWGDAATQIFYSLGIGFGGLLTMSSYNRFKNNVFRDTLIVACINCGTSIFAGFAIFSLLGFMATVTNQEVKDVATEGPGLAFIAYPEGIARLPVAPVWAFLFFFMLLTLGMDSQFAMMETVISGITDIFPNVLRKRKLSFTLFCCLIGFLIGIPITTKGGILVLTLFDWYVGSYNLMFLALMEIICLMAVYGWRNFCEDTKMMVGYTPNIYWLATWLFFTPLSLLFILAVSGINYAPPSYDMVVFPGWAEGIGWTMAALPVVVFFLVAIIQVIRYGGIREASRPTADWGPALPEDRTIPRYQIGTDNAAYEADEENVMTNGKQPPPYNISGDKYVVRM